MSHNETSEMADVLDRVRTWPADEQIHLAQQILQSVAAQRANRPDRSRSLKNLLGILQPANGLPSDADCRAALETALMEKHGS